MTATTCLSHLPWRPSCNKWDHYQRQGLASHMSVPFKAYGVVASNGANTSWWPRQRVYLWLRQEAPIQSWSMQQAVALMLCLLQPVTRRFYISRDVISIISTISTVRRTIMRSYNDTFQQLWVITQIKPHWWHSSIFQFISVSATVIYKYQCHSGCFHSISNSYWKFSCSNISFTWDNFVSVAFGVIFWYWVQYLVSNQLENTGGL